MPAFISAKYSQPKPMRVDSTSTFFTDTAAVTTGLVANDTVDFVLPAGTDLFTLIFDIPDLDSNGAPAILFRAGYRKLNASDTLVAVDNYFAAAGQTTAQTGGRLNCVFAPIKFDVDVIVGLTINTTAATPVAGTIRMTAGYNQVGAR